MRHKIAASVLITIAIMVFSGCQPPSSAGVSEKTTHLSNRHFAIGLHQNGKKIKIVNNTAVLKKGPFDIFVAFPLPGGLFVNASLKPNLLKQANAGQNLGKTIAFRGISENRNNCLIVGDDSWQYWYYRGPGISKFDDVRGVTAKTGGETWICKKVLRSYRVKPSQLECSFKGIKSDTLYMVFVAAPWTADLTPKRVQQASEFLRIIFR